MVAILEALIGVADGVVDVTGSNGGEAAGESGAGGRPCPLCEAPMRTRHCKYVCPNHGVVYDCSDTFY